MALFLFSTKLSKTLSVRLIHFFIFFEFFWVFLGFFFELFPNPRVRAVLLFYSKTSVSHCSPPHPPSVGLKTHGGWVGGVEVLEVSRPLPGQNCQPPHAARVPASQRGGHACGGWRFAPAGASTPPHLHTPPPTPCGFSTQQTVGGGEQWETEVLL